MEQFSLPTLKLASTILTWAAFWLAVSAAVVGALAAQVRSETGRRADLRVATAEQAAAQAKSTAAAANVRAEELKGDNLATQERLVAAERKLEAERTARLEIERRLSARHITSDQVETLRQHLNATTHVDGEPVTVAVFPTAGTMEAANYSKELAIAIQTLGFSFNPNNVHYGTPYLLNGVGILCSEDADALARGMAFYTAFEAAGIVCVMLPPRTAQEPLNPSARQFNQSISLMVGDRPET